MELFKSRSQSKWSNVKMLLVDAPAVGNTYEFRVKTIGRLAVPSHVKFVPCYKCKSAEHFKEFVAEVMASGGAGVVLRKQQSLYEIGLSSTLQKYKVFNFV